MATNWKEEEVLKLIEIWSEDSLQVMLEGSKRNKSVFMKTVGFKKSLNSALAKLKG